MAKQNRETLKQYFQTGNSPTQAQFADLIDSALNQTDDSIICDAKGQIGIGSPTPTANLNVRGRLFTPLSGTLSVKKGETAAIGIGTTFDVELEAGDAIQISEQRFKVAGVTDATHLELATAATAVIENAHAYRDANLLLIENGNGDTQFVIDKSGNVGIGTATPTARLHVNGKVQAAELAGKGASITNLNAANLEGTLKLAQLPQLTAEQIPSLPPSKITGQLNVDQIPLLTAKQIPDLPASKISGQLKPNQIPELPTSPNVEWIGELKQAISVEQSQVAIGPIPPFTDLVISRGVPGALGPILTLMNPAYGAGSGAAIDFDGWPALNVPPTARIQSIDDGAWSSDLTFHTKQPGAPENPLAERLRIDSRGNVGIGVATPRAKLDISVPEDSGAVLSAGAVSGAKCSVNLAGHVELRQYGASKQAYFQARDDSDPSAIGLVIRVQQAGDAGKQRYLEAMTIDERGNIGLRTAPTDAHLQVQGILRADKLEGSGAGITGVSAANITGQLDLTQIPQIPASKISGPLTVDQIPNLPPSKVTGAITGQAVGPGGRPLLASGNVSPGTTQNIFQIPMTPVNEPIAFYSLEIYTTYYWFDVENPAGGLTNFYNVMTRTVMAGAVTVAPDFFQVEPLIAGPTQTNHPEPKFPTVSFALVNDNNQAWLQMQTTGAGGAEVLDNLQPSQVLYYVYSLM